MSREQSYLRLPAEMHGSIIQSTLMQSRSTAGLQHAAAILELLNFMEL